MTQNINVHVSVVIIKMETVHLKDIPRGFYEHTSQTPVLESLLPSQANLGPRVALGSLLLFSGTTSIPYRSHLLLLEPSCSLSIKKCAVQCWSLPYNVFILQSLFEIYSGSLGPPLGLYELTPDQPVGGEAGRWFCPVRIKFQKIHVPFCTLIIPLHLHIKILIYVYGTQINTRIYMHSQTHAYLFMHTHKYMLILPLPITGLDIMWLSGIRKQGACLSHLLRPSGRDVYVYCAPQASGQTLVQASLSLSLTKAIWVAAFSTSWKGHLTYALQIYLLGIWLHSLS